MLKYLLVLGSLLGPSLAETYPRVLCTSGKEDIYQFNATYLDESATISFDQYKGTQEPGNGYDEITNGVKYVRPGGGFEPKLTFFQKTEVNGDTENPIYTFLKGSCPMTSDTFAEIGLFYSPKKVGDITWNFEKFLLGKDGKVYARYHPSVTDPKDLETDIDYLLSL